MKKSTMIGVILAVFVFASMLVVSAKLEPAEPVGEILQEPVVDSSAQPTCGSSACAAEGGCGGTCGGACGVPSCGCGR